MPFVSKRADLLERALQGLPCTDHEVRSLVATVSRIPALTSAACAPRNEFVNTLGLRLRAEALVMPARSVPRASSAAVTGRSATEPAVFVIGRRLRVLAGATASLLLIGAVLGVTSRSALPGGLLYPVKQVLNSAAVQLAGSDFDRGVTLLSQAQEHLGDARSLVERDRASADPASVDQALISANDAVRAGQGMLTGEFDRTGNTQALIAVQDFTVRAMPQLEALRPQVPAASRPDVDALIALLHQTRATLARMIDACGLPCASVGGGGLGSPIPAAPSTGLLSSLPAGGLLLPGLPAGGPPVFGPVPAITGPGGVVGPAIPLLAITGNGLGATLPPVTSGPITVSLPPIVIPAPALPPPPTGQALLP